MTVTRSCVTVTKNRWSRQSLPLYDTSAYYTTLLTCEQKKLIFLCLTLYVKLIARSNSVNNCSIPILLDMQLYEKNNIRREKNLTVVLFQIVVSTETHTEGKTIRKNWQANREDREWSLTLFAHENTSKWLDLSSPFRDLIHCLLTIKVYLSFLCFLYFVTILVFHEYFLCKQLLKEFARAINFA